ncbi:cold-regulated protein 28-like isoform X2 [Populus nigra]|uniref:cold-regulated protein 28-like isoform X2 n=1 Tax=Populus nigra TaxID=3691 RepID=UPI002B26AE49|nr:cold-regulated protein 28-like isoform X2 [Populus nigra]
MEEGNLRGDIPLPDQKKKSNSELTRANSESSGLSVDNANARPGQGPSAAWTDEKHRLYLDSLEASFVNKQLRHSFSLRGWLREMGGRPCSSKPQFTVLRHCRWEKKRNEPLLESTADSHFIEETTRWTNQWEAAHHDLQGHVASCGGGIRVRENATVSCGLARSSEQHSMCCLCYQNSIGSTIEVSDQNFVEEHQGEELTCIHMLKRLGRSGAEASRNDKKI